MFAAIFDEAAVARWREHARHRGAQQRGCEDIFADCRMRVAEVVCDYGMAGRAGAGVRSGRFRFQQPVAAPGPARSWSSR